LGTRPFLLVANIDLNASNRDRRGNFSRLIPLVTVRISFEEG